MHRSNMENFNVFSTREGLLHRKDQLTQKLDTRIAESLVTHSQQSWSILNNKKAIK